VAEVQVVIFDIYPVEILTVMVLIWK